MSEPLPRDILILYATETGTAQDAAEKVARHCRRIHFTCRVLSTDEYSLSDLVSEPLVLFIVATTGSGVEPRSMATMWRTLLRSDLPSDLFDELAFAVFGLGDSSYEKFCWAAKKLSRRMASLGALEICERGEGDDQDSRGIDGSLDLWIKKVLEVLLERFPLPDHLTIVPADRVPPPRAKVDRGAHWSLQKSDSLDNMTGYHTATLKSNTRITAPDWNQDVRHFEFSFQDQIQYSPGDVAVIRPAAFPDEVEAFLECLGWLDIADAAFHVESNLMDQKLPEHLPDVVTPRMLFTEYLDFNAVPRRTFFEYLSFFTKNELELERLQELLSYENADELYDYCFRVRRTIFEVLSEFRNVEIPLQYVFDVFPTMRPRHFSIASSAKKFPQEVQLCVAIVKYRTKLKVPRRGVCTSYLASLKPGQNVQVRLQRGFIDMPKDPRTPIICIGPGTGIAPMRAIIQERNEIHAFANTLYFGCRSSDKDEHYGGEWRQLCQDSQMAYRVAFSRDGAPGQPRVYVQDLMRQDAGRIWSLLEAGAIVFISGSSNKMPAAVKSALAYAAETHGGLELKQTADWITSLENAGRLFEECWS
ncbi:unnamed protein product [Mycena citricolor]|uniref:NADPH-dependent diflavin oxidoreductase 1 n=1 Tax=Mycena citricolor TaxID=2018698 RepID=A0AAD2JYE5_9AGAR|nr:unnamed protein product [Mycena citricolor]